MNDNEMVICTHSLCTPYVCFLNRFIVHDPCVKIRRLYSTKPFCFYAL